MKDKNKPELTWNIFRYDINKKEIYVFNVFDHGRFFDDVKKMQKTAMRYHEFAEELRVTAMYYFWCKAEHEIVITSFPPYISKDEADRIANEEFNYKTQVSLDCGLKIDIFHQLSMNWDKFVDYVWTNKVRD